MQHLDFTHRAMTDMHLDRTVIGSELRRWPPAAVQQLHHIRLDHAQQRAAPGYLIGLGLNGFHAD